MPNAGPRAAAVDAAHERGARDAVTRDRAIQRLVAAGGTATTQHSASFVPVPGVVPLVVPIRQTATPGPGTPALMAGALALVAGHV